MARVSSEAERVRKRLLGTRSVTLAANEGWWQVACVCRVANGQAGTRFVSGSVSDDELSDDEFKGRQDWELREHEIIVVKLLRAYGGCLGASRR